MAEDKDKQPAPERPKEPAPTRRDNEKIYESEKKDKPLDVSDTFQRPKNDDKK